MATIRPNDNAPGDTVRFLLGSEEFELAPGGSYETDNRLILSDAEVHPWLNVSYEDEVAPEEAPEPAPVTPFTPEVVSLLGGQED